MAGRFLAAGLILSAALAFLLVFASGSSTVDATTFKIQYSGDLSCAGPDGIDSTGDDSCVPAAPPIGAHGAGLTADVVSLYNIPDFGPPGAPNHSNHSMLATMGTPVNWKLATDKEIPNGAYMGTLAAQSTLALFGGICNTNLVVPLPMYDCTTDNFEGVNDGCPTVVVKESGPKCNDHEDNDGDTLVNDGCPKVGATSETGAQCANAIDDDGDADPIIAWDLALEGNNLVYGKEGGLPAGCTAYPSHINSIVEGLRPRARYFGLSMPLANMRPTQVEFMFFSTEEMTAIGALPHSDMGDAGGYINQVFTDNPPAPTVGGANLDEFCTPLSTTTNMLGKTGGEGGLDQDVPPMPAGYAGSPWNILDACGDGIDNDDDGQTDEMCGIERVRNPAAGTGIDGSGTHLVKAYGESYRDADGDTVNNYEDECPLLADDDNDDDGDHVDDACDPTPGGDAEPDEDKDTYRNQQDYCPLNSDRECEFGAAAGLATTDGDCADAGEAAFCGLDANDSDGDTLVNDGCPAVGPPETGANCENATDDDGDNAINDGCRVGGNIDKDDDRIGDACDPDDTTPNGNYINEFSVGAVCVGELDTDGDGWCDSTEIALGSDEDDGGPPHETPESYVVDMTVNAAEDPPGAGPQSCTNYDYYDVTEAHPATPHQNGVGTPIDDDGDTLTNDTGATPDPGCTCPGDDADCDGVADTPDNCDNDYNPTQLDTDGDTAGDACDDDDDQDKTKDVDEWAISSDPKDVCDPASFDLNTTAASANVINILDVLMFSNAIMGKACYPPTNYAVCEPIYR